MHRKHTSKKFFLNPFKRKRKSQGNLDLDSLERSLHMTETIKEDMQSSIDTLFAQGEQIKRIQNEIDETEVIEETAEQSLWSIHSLFGALAKEVTPTPTMHNNIKKGDKLIHAEEKKRQRARKKAERKSKQQSKSSSNTSQTDKVFKKMEKNVAEMHKQALIISDTLDDQNVRLDILKDTTNQVEQEVVQLDSRMKI